MALQTRTADGMRQVRKTLTIRRSADDLFAVWNDLVGLPSFMEHVESVTKNGPISHWKVKGPAGSTVEWDAKVVASAPNQISWQTLPGSEIRHFGEVRFTSAPEDRGTEVTVTLRYDPPAGKPGVKVARMFGEEPSIQLDTDLYRFKQLMEAGRLPTADGQPHGAR